MNNYYQQYPTHGDLAREQLRRRDLPYFADVQQEIETRLTMVAAEIRTAFALACAERLMRWHEALPQEEQQPFTLGWRPVLDIMWDSLRGQGEEVPEQVRIAFDAFQVSPYNHDNGPDDPQDADEDAAAASIYTAECFLSGGAKAAACAAKRAMDHAFAVAGEDLQLDSQEFVWSPEAEPMPLAQEAMHPAVLKELRQQLADIETLEQQGMTPELLRRLSEPSEVQ